MAAVKQKLNTRWFYLSIGFITMLFAGIIYAWSILKVPFANEFSWTPSNLALNFTITMCFFCAGGFLGSKLEKKFGSRLSLIISGVASMLGFILTSRLMSNQLVLLYLTYGVLTGTGIGISYNVVVATISKWFPDKKGVCSGALMVGFGSSALVLGNLASKLFSIESFGWRPTFVALGISLGIIIILAALILKKPSDDIVLPKPKEKKSRQQESFEYKDYTTTQMISRPSFWLIFIFLLSIGAVGSSVISFAKDLAIFTNASDSLATSLVGFLSICNGLGRIIAGTIFDIIGRRKTMYISGLCTVCATGITLIAVSFKILPLCIIGLCLTGIAYGSSATICAASTYAFYGTKSLSSNMSVMTCNLVPASFVATFCSKLFTFSGGYTVPFILLLALSILSLILSFFIKKP